MKAVKHIITIGLLLILSFACSPESGLVDTEDLVAKEYDLPQGTEGSTDRAIYNIHEKYGTYLLYSFEETDFRRKWDGKWVAWYTPAVTGENLKYVDKFVELLDKSVLSKYDETFVRRNFPYKVFFVDSLSSSSSYSKRNERNVLSNGYNAIAVANVGPRVDTWSENDWLKIGAELDKAFSLFYYSSLTEKPIKFLSLRFTKLFFSTLTDPTGEYDKYKYSCYSTGFVNGRLNAYLTPDEEEDFADFIWLITGNTGTELTNIFSRFPIMFERAKALYIFMNSKMDMNLVKTQNANFPDDKLPLNVFD